MRAQGVPLESVLRNGEDWAECTRLGQWSLRRYAFINTPTCEISRAAIQKSSGPLPERRRIWCSEVKIEGKRARPWGLRFRSELSLETDAFNYLIQSRGQGPDSRAIKAKRDGAVRRRAAPGEIEKGLWRRFAAMS